MPVLGYDIDSRGGRVGVNAIKIGKDDRVSSLTKPVRDYVPSDVYLGVNSTLSGSALKLLCVGVTGVSRHLLLQRQQELADALGLSSVPSPETKSDLGGVDFGSVELRYLAEFEESSNWVLNAAFKASPTAAEASVDLTQAGELSWNAFFIWLSLLSDRFWVNLNPSEPNRIIDAELAKTDVGRIMLEADLQLKRDVAQLLHPETSSTGRNFWDSLFRYVERSVDVSASKGVAIPTSFRVWIIPAPVDVWATEESIYIVKARLDAKLESYYSQGLSGEAMKFKKLVPRNVSEIQAYAETLLRRDILSLLVENINNSPRYSELRQVYHSFVVAEWYKTGHSSDSPAFAQLIGSRSTEPWPARVTWSATDVFDEFVKSLQNGEFNIFKEETDTVGFTIRTRTRQHLYGGIDFTRIQLEPVTASELAAQEADLPELLFDAFYAGGGYEVARDSSEQWWLGGTFVAPTD